MDVMEDALYVGVVTPAAVGEADAAMVASEQWEAEILFEHANTMRDCGRSDVEFSRRPGKALVAGGGVEVAQTLEGKDHVA